MHFFLNILEVKVPMNMNINVIHVIPQSGKESDIEGAAYFTPFLAVDGLLIGMSLCDVVHVLPLPVLLVLHPNRQIVSDVKFITPCFAVLLLRSDVSSHHEHLVERA